MRKLMVILLLCLLGAQIVLALPASKRLPDGPYQKTCQGCYMNRTFLTCQCKTHRKDVWRWSNISRWSNCSIENRNGFLKCANPNKHTSKKPILSSQQVNNSASAPSEVLNHQ